MPSAEPALRDAQAPESVTQGASEAGATPAAPTNVDATATPAAARGAAIEVSSPGYPAAALHDTFEKNSAKLVACFARAHKADPKLRGHVNVKFDIGPNGRVARAKDDGSNLPDDAVVGCVVRTVKALSFPKPAYGTITVAYPFLFHSYEPLLVLPDSAGPSK